MIFTSKTFLSARYVICAWLISLLGLISTSALAVLPVVPVFLKETFPPNVIFTIDDSGSMCWGFAPDSIGPGAWATPRFYASTYNPLYFDPAKTYAVPPKPDGTQYTASNFAAAPMDPYVTTPVTMNLNSYRPTHCHLGNDTGANENTVYYNGYNGGRAQPKAAIAYYSFYDISNAGCAVSTAVTIENDACYTKVSVSAAQQQNFANWYTFYRTRNLLVKSSLLLAMKSFPDETRIAWQGLNTCNSGFGTACTAGGSTFTNRMGEFSGTHKTDFLTWVTKGPANSGTPLQDAFVLAGKYYQTVSTSSENPYLPLPGTAGGALSSCRLSYHVALTDGLWNTGTLPEATSAGPILDADNRSWTLGDAGKTIAYTPIAPYKKTDAAIAGTWVNLADIAYYYWATDLQPTAGVPNNVSPYSASGNKLASHLWPTSEQMDPRNDPAYWQHMVNFTIGLGLERNLTNPQWQGSTFASDASGNGYAQFASGAATWPATGGTDSGNVYDLWHAAINSRGEFFSVNDSTSLIVAFKRILSRISSKTGTVGAVGAGSSAIYSDTALFQAGYDSTNWSGTISRRNVDKYGVVATNVSWSTDTTLASLAVPNRWVRATKTGTNPNPGVLNLTNYASFDAATKLTLVSASVAGWLNGSSVDERTSTCTTCTLRGRKDVTGNRRLLGDILGSAPVLSAKEDFGYANASWASTTVSNAYVAYLRAKASKTPVLVVGANDGFVHVLNASAGTGGGELFAFAPGAVTSKLADLADLNYVKAAYVDGPVIVGDAYLSASWKTYAVGAMGPGGKAVYAIDITNPGALDGSSVKWEFTDADMGNLISKPLIVRLPSGTWAALFSSGYESSRATPILYTVNLETGALIAKTDTGANKTGCDVTITAANYPYNGLGALRHYNTKSGTAAITYAGDLAGHLWRFVWGSTDTPSASILAKACRNSLPQAITAAPGVTSLGAEPFVYFGTGKLFATGDTAITTPLNTMYAVLDDIVFDASAPARTRSDLAAQTITTSGASPNRRRVISTNDVNLVDKRGWYLDLDLSGERIVTQAALFDQRTMFTTFLPDTTSCDTAGTSFAFSLDSSTGSAPSVSSFDVDGNGTVGNAGDLVGGKVVGAIEVAATLASPAVAALSSSPSINSLVTDAATGISTRRAGACRANELRWTIPKAYDTTLVTGCVPGPLARSGWRQIK